MFSFRRDQFRAMLLSLLITDALCHQQISSGTQRFCVDKSSTSHCEAGFHQALTSDRWSHALTHSLDYLVRTPPATPAFLDKQSQTLKQTCDRVETVAEVVLVILPVFLQSLDNPRIGQRWHNQVPSSWQKATLVYYEWLLALLEPDINHTTKHHRPSNASDAYSETDAVIANAIRHHRQADGSFPLAVGCSYRFADEQPGLPILSGLLSASQVGSKGIPIAWQQALQNPKPKLKEWLEQRWRISSATIVDTWADALFHHWLGQHQPFLSGNTDLMLTAIRPRRR
ncbi:MAG: hypothetical protein AAGH78_02035 [Cyanobacteria bacterium P01_H01_bin.58]